MFWRNDGRQEDSQTPLVPLQPGMVSDGPGQKDLPVLRRRGRPWHRPSDDGCLDVLDGLYSHQIREFPVLAVHEWLTEAGIKTNALNFIKAAIRKAKRREDR